ncbi:MAG TPA: glutathione S-transferase [Rhodobiaceae bacterium]|jgi:glutathione S-transferase|nr:glutathione S-transferase [Rhodobiaceae bacterium]
MSDIRIISYLPNPRVYKATIVARHSGAVIDVIGDKPPEMANWLWDYQAIKMSDADKQAHASARRTAKTGFSGALYKTDAFLKANPFGDIPAAFAEDGTMGIFESNSIMRLAALTGPEAPALYGDSPATRARIDGFLDKTLLFADIIQKYILAGDGLDAALHGQMAGAFHNYCTALEAALGHHAYVSGDALSLSDVVLVCELALMSNESRMADQLAAAACHPILPELKTYPALHAHVTDLLGRSEFAEDLSGYARFILA